LVGRESPTQFVDESQLIVIGHVTHRDTTTFSLKPEAFLKGPASSEPLTFKGGDIDLCPLAPVNEGDRLLVYVFNAGDLQWPLVTSAYVLRDGEARMESATTVSEASAISQIRAITGQYAVPAASKSEGGGIDWSGTVLPLSIVLVIVFVIGLALMRVWHRIDPS
jgi:hypothetical protein